MGKILVRSETTSKVREFVRRGGEGGKFSRHKPAHLSAAESYLETLYINVFFSNQNFIYQN